MKTASLTAGDFAQALEEGAMLGANHTTEDTIRRIVKKIRHERTVLKTDSAESTAFSKLVERGLGLFRDEHLEALKSCDIYVLPVSDCLAHASRIEGRKVMLASLKAMGERLAELDVLIAETEIELDENALARQKNAERLATWDELEELVRDGKLDANNPTHADKLRLLGISYDDALNPQERERRRLEDEAERLRLWNQHIDLTRNYERYVQEQEELADQVEQIANDPSQAPDVRAEAILIREARERRTEQRTIERSGAIEQTNATDALKQEQVAMQSDEDRMDIFSKRLAQIKQIPDELERLKAEQTLLQGLSEDEQMMASFDTEAEYLFTEGYFDRLQGSPHIEVAAVTQPAQGPTYTN
jgi:hypothetical protein